MRSVGAGSLNLKRPSRRLPCTSGVQLADFLGPRLPQAGGIITLSDVYCLFNRARGTELISPDDLLQAVSLFPGIAAGMHLRTFASGVLVVQSDAHNDDEVSSQLLDLFCDCPPSPGVMRPPECRLYICCAVERHLHGCITSAKVLHSCQCALLDWPRLLFDSQ